MVSIKIISEIKILNNYILITLDDKSKYKISEDDLFKYKYKANMSLNSDDLEILKNCANFHSAYLRALVRIKYQDRTVSEIKNTLYSEFEIKPYEVNAIIEKLLYYGFLDDRRYTVEKIEMFNKKSFGFNKIKNKLFEVGISNDLINEYLIFDYDLEKEKALDIAKKSLKSIKNKNQHQTIQRLRNRLSYQGFSSQIISAVVNELNVAYNEKDEAELIDKEIAKSLRVNRNKYQGKDLYNRIYNQLRNRGFKHSLIKEKLLEMEFLDE